ncbi:hypothetical protein K8I31_11780, partial [bacterium]|nr:hypothetical protein [bacterium]
KQPLENILKPCENHSVIVRILFIVIVIRLYLLFLKGGGTGLFESILSQCFEFSRTGRSNHMGFHMNQ